MARNGFLQILNTNFAVSRTFIDFTPINLGNVLKFDVTKHINSLICSVKLTRLDKRNINMKGENEVKNPNRIFIRKSRFKNDTF